jgi:dephospho-CoA kinase
MKFRIAVTGGVAQGKSTVVETLASIGWKTVSADDVARQLASASEVRQEIAATLGLPPNYERAELRLRVAGDPKARLELNSILHFRTVRALGETEADVVEVPLLFEAGLLTMADEVWTVWCSAENQLRRLTQRLGDAAQARLWMAAQLPSSVKVALSDWDVNTDQPRESVAALVTARAGRAATP